MLGKYEQHQQEHEEHHAALRDRGAAATAAFAAVRAWCRRAEYHMPTRASTIMANSATSENQTIEPWPRGRMMKAASSGPIAPPRLPPTWKIDCARP